MAYSQIFIIYYTNLSCQRVDLSLIGYFTNKVTIYEILNGKSFVTVDKKEEQKL